MAKKVDAVDRFYQNMGKLFVPKSATGKWRRGSSERVPGGGKKECARRMMQRLSFHNTEKVERA